MTQYNNILEAIGHTPLVKLNKIIHSAMPEKERLKRGIKENQTRISVGLENKEDLKDDLKRALS